MELKLNQNQNQKNKINKTHLTPYDLLKLIGIILVVILIGMFAVNQTLTYFYKSAFLQTPCQLCLSENKELDLCPKVNYYPSLDVGNLTIIP